MIFCISRVFPDNGYHVLSRHAINVINRLDLVLDKSVIDLTNEDTTDDNVLITSYVPTCPKPTLKLTATSEFGDNCSKDLNVNSEEKYDGLCNSFYYSNVKVVLTSGDKNIEKNIQVKYSASFPTPNPTVNPTTDPSVDPSVTPSITISNTPKPSGGSTPIPTNHPSPTPRPTPNPTNTATPRPTPSPSPSDDDFDPFAVYSNVSADNLVDLDNKMSNIENLNKNFIAKEMGFKIAAKPSKVTHRINYELGQGTSKAIGSTITLYCRRATSAIVTGNVFILDSKSKEVTKYPKFSSIIAVNKPITIKKPINGGKNFVSIPGFEGSFRPGFETHNKYEWFGRYGNGAGPYFVPKGSYEVKTIYDTIYIGSHTPLPNLNEEAFIDVYSDFPEYTKALPKKIPLEVQEHIASKHRINYISRSTARNDSYTSFVDQYDLFSQVKNDSSIDSKKKFDKKLNDVGLLGTEYGKGTCFYSDTSNPLDSLQIWTNKVIMQQITSIANMEDGSDKWSSGNTSDRIVITGTRSVGGISHVINAVVDLKLNKIWTGIPIGGSIIKENSFTKYYYDLPWSNFLQLTNNKGENL